MPDSHNVLAEKLGYYLWYCDYAASQVRYLPDLNSHYDRELESWNERNLLLPPVDDLEKRKAYFAYCDKIISMTPTTPGEYV